VVNSGAQEELAVLATLVTSVWSNTNPVMNSGAQEELAVLATLVTPVWSKMNPVVNSGAQEELAILVTLVTPVWSNTKQFTTGLVLLHTGVTSVARTANSS
jgi:hypothetical protein